MFEKECDVVMDLLPLYVEHEISDERPMASDLDAAIPISVISPASKRMVDAHLKECRACSDAYMRMRAEMPGIKTAISDEKKRKGKFHIRKDILVVSGAVLLYILMIGVIVIWLFIKLSAGIL